MKETYACEHCGAEADMTIEGMEKVEDVIRRERKLPCKNCGKEVPWTGKEEIKAIRVDMDDLKIEIKEEKKASAYYRSMAELTRDPRGKDMYKRLADEEKLHEKVLN